MTDRLAALKEIAFYGEGTLRDNTLAGFYQNWRHEALVVNQWFQVQAAIPDSLGLSRVQALMSHGDFELRNPNKVRALVGGFIHQNPVNFHRIDGAGYRFRQ
jgi:aminopeptidase N